MPQLTVQLMGLPTNFSVDWSVKVSSERGSLRSNDDNFTTSITNINAATAWNITNSYPTSQAYDGGTNTITYGIRLGTNTSYLGTSSTPYFIVRGLNPLDATAKSYINLNLPEDNPDVTQWYWAMVEEEGWLNNNTIFNQFNSGGSLAEQPNYSADGDNGWGMAQLDSPLGTNASTLQVYNWQTNVQGLYSEMEGYEIPTEQRFLNAVASHYTNTSAQNPPNITIGTVTYTALAAGAIVLYNGIAGCPPSTIGGVTYTNAWSYSPSGGWTFTDNVNHYLSNVTTYANGSAGPFKE